MPSCVVSSRWLVPLPHFTYLSVFSTSFRLRMNMVSFGGSSSEKVRKDKRWLEEEDDEDEEAWLLVFDGRPQRLWITNGRAWLAYTTCRYVARCHQQQEAI